MRRAGLRLLLSFALLGGCTTGEGGPDGGDAAMDAGAFDAGPARDAGPFDAGDPFAPDGSCGRALIETTRLPGSLLLVYDRSGSMDAPVVSGGSGPTRWELARAAIEGVLDGLPDEANVGMLLFPVASQGMCAVTLGADAPQVPVAPLSESRAAIAAQLAITPTGPATPIFAALQAGWDHLDALGGRGERGLVLVTDGRENCADEERDRVLAQAATVLADRGHLTFAVGLTQSNSDLSTLAFNGGTARNDTCLPECTTQACVIDSDTPCTSGAQCATFPDGEGGSLAGFCGCLSMADCPAPTTCAPDPTGMGSICVGEPNCCHYDATASSFETDLTAALEAIAQRVLSPCVFDLPRGDDPAMFDPNQVNVRVTLDGGDPQVIGRSDDETIDSWDYASPAQDAIEITGPICDALQDGGTVEIVLGCPTILI